MSEDLDASNKGELADKGGLGIKGDRFRYTPGLGFWTSDNDGLEEPEWAPADQEVAEEMVGAAKVWLRAKKIKEEA